VITLSLGEKINELRLKHKLSTHQLADKLGISQAHISKLESDKNKPSLSLLEKMSEMFDVHITYFFDQKKIDVNIEGAEYVATEKENFSENDLKNMIEFVKDVKNGKFDLSKIQNIHFKD
jgi:transcriptional regulator with XRE-family HTH domain